ncbi:MAG: serine hydrolase [Bacteroidales bacterium]|nr:serine hydrolase [Bacteroidales bacterium]
MKRSEFYLKTRALFLAVLMVSSMLVFTNCGGGSGGTGKAEPENTTPAISSACNLSLFQFKAASNPGLPTNPTAVITTIRGFNMVLITVPESTDLTKLVPTFSASDKATVTIAGKAAVSGTTSVNFTGDVSLIVKAEDGTHSKQYTVLVRKGDAEMDAQVYSIMSKYNIPGISVATTKKEKLAYAAGYGYANMESSPKQRVTPDMLFRLASVSKFQCALCIMSLYEDGLLSPDDYVFAPAGANGEGSKEGILQSMYPGAHAAGVDKIKVRHLLTHTSGWNYSTTANSSGTVDPIFTGDSRFYGKTLKQRVEYMVNTPTSYTPGANYSYYNLGYCVLGQIVEKITGGTYEAYLKEVEAKAGVTDVWIAKNSKSQRRDNEVCYYAQQSTDAYQNDMAVVAACGAVINSAVNLMQLVCAIDYGTVVPDILQKETLDMVYTDYTSADPPKTKGGYGFGWRIGHNTLTNWASYHGGNINGTATIIVRGKNGVHGVLLCNSRSYIDDFDTALYLALNNIMSRTNDIY